WMCSVITPPGTLRQLKRTSCPPVSSATAVNSIHTPVAALRKGRNAVMRPSSQRLIERKFLLASDGVQGGVVDRVDSTVGADDGGGVSLRARAVEADLLGQGVVG